MAGMPTSSFATSAAFRALHLYRKYAEFVPAQRRLALDRLEHDDPQAHAVLAAMLASHASADQPDELSRLLDLSSKGSRGEAEPPIPDPRLGRRLGAWRIERKIGEGGMGSVYEAHRDDGQYQQRVALKCMRAELSAPTLVQAFLSERNHLAQLQHPHIAALIDGNVEADGQPWFAMQYVEGEPLDNWCDECRLPLRARVKLFLQACDALAYAHSRGVLHQDLKPTNMLVTAEGHLLLLDFGLSSPLVQETAERSAPVAISPGYTAPEIVFGWARPSVAGEVYSLGAVLGRLLSGMPPTASLLLQMAQQSAQQTLPGLIERARAAAPDIAGMRGLGSNAQLARHLSGDLNAIAGRCTAADPQQRYASVVALRDDLQRWLQRRPVGAARQGRARDRLYRMRLFLRRHALTASLVGLAGAALIAGAGIALRQMQRAQREVQATLIVGRLFEETLGSAALSGLGELPFSSSALLRETEAKVRSLDLREQPQVLARALATLARSQAVIGDYARATALAGEASRLQDSNSAPSADTQATLASLLNIQARPAEAQKVAQAALGGLAENAPGATRLRLLTEAARSEWTLDDRAEAGRTLDSALALARKYADHDPTPYIELLTLRGQWNTQRFLFPAAEADLREALALALPGDAQLANRVREKMVALLTLVERRPEALRLAQALLDSRRLTLGERHPETGRAWVLLAEIQCFDALSDACRVSAQHGKDILRASYGESHPEYAKALWTFSQTYFFDEGSYLARLQEMRRVVAILSAAYGPDNGLVLRDRAFLAATLLTSPEISSLSPQMRSGFENEGFALFETTLADARRYRTKLMVGTYIPYAIALSKRNRPGDLALAESVLEEAQSEARAFGPSHSFGFRISFSLAQLRYQAGNLVDADARLATLTPQVEAALPQVNARFIICSILWFRAAIALRNGHPEQAKAYLIRRHEEAVRWLGSEHPLAKEARNDLDLLVRTGRFSVD